MRLILGSIISLSSLVPEFQEELSLCTDQGQPRDQRHRGHLAATLDPHLAMLLNQRNPAQVLRQEL